MKTYTAESEVREIAERFIERNQPADYRLVITDVGNSDGFERFVVYVDTQPREVSGTDFAGKLADIELQMEDAGEDIMLHPTLWQQD